MAPLHSFSSDGNEGVHWRHNEALRPPKLYLVGEYRAYSAYPLHYLAYQCFPLSVVLSELYKSIQAVLRFSQLADKYRMPRKGAGKYWYYLAGTSA